MDATKQFAQIRNERTSAAGRAAIDVAERLFQTATETEHMREARQWVELGLKCDKAVADGDLAGALAKLQRKSVESSALDRARKVAGH